VSSIPPKVRSEVQERDHGRCRWCGSPNAEAHHIQYRSQGGTHTADNLILLCQRHHQLVHSDKRQFMPILIATLEFQERGVSLTVPQVQRWLGQQENT
jgi:5-methylcytosine-specific restriction endonuclease McrA